jgi:hypothetical protein
VHAPTKDKSDDTKDSFYEELDCVFNQFPKYHMKILLRDYNAKVRREDIFINQQSEMRVYMILVIIMGL